MSTGTTLTRVLVTVCAAILALSACAAPSPAPSPTSSVAPSLAPSDGASPTPSAPAASETEVEVFFAHNQPSRLTLISERHTVVLEPGADAVEVVVGALVDGRLRPTDPDYSTLWGTGENTLRSTTREGSTLVLDVSLGGLSVGAEAESIAIAQLVWTATAIDPTIESVRLTVNGASVDALAGHVDVTGPFSREAPETVLSPVQIDEPTHGTALSSPVSASGVACVFEAAFTWRMEGPDGETREGAGMAAEACPARAPWSLDLGDLSPGAYVLTVVELSARDGSIASSDSKSCTVLD